MRIINLEHYHALPGGVVGQPHDRACVLSETETEPHPITKQPQPKMLFLGTLEGAHEFVKNATTHQIEKTES